MTDAFELRRKKADVVFEKAYEAEAGSELANAYEKALSSSETEDSEVQLVVLACECVAPAIELGTRYIRSHGT